MMKPIRVKIQKIRGSRFIRLPNLIADRYNLHDGDEIEIRISNRVSNRQAELWDRPIDDLNQIAVKLLRDGHSMNMYNRIYVPTDLRFFFPPKGIDFLLITNVGNILTHLTADGFIKKNIRPWLAANGPLTAGDELDFVLMSDHRHAYQLRLIRSG